MESSSELSELIHFSMMGLVLCSLVLVTRLQDRFVDGGEVVALVTVHGWLVQVDVDGLADFA